jgi:asparagine synthase (glutamine-hydrolysing)
MCGIVGLLELKGAAADLEDVRAMASVLAYRGPDGQGVWSSGPVALGHRRLSIIDLSDRARQPMTNHDGTVHLVFNGEIYNFKELRGLLEKAGYVFRSQSDSEVLVLGYEQWGIEGLLERLIGIFAFALWDDRQEKLYLVRDHLGVKPLYYGLFDGRLLFASEIKALYAAGFPFLMDCEMGPELLVFGHVAGSRTPVRGVRRLEPGTYTVWGPGSSRPLKTVQYWNLFEQTRLRSTATEEEIEGLLRETARLQRVSDVTLGTLCSGGIDSSLITALLADTLNEPLHSFCVVYDEQGVVNEGPYARAVSARLNTQHHETLLTAESFASNLDELSWANDEPLAHSNDVALYLVARDARPYVTVLWSGEGGDELFAGYVRYVAPDWYQHYRRPIKWLLNIASHIPKLGSHQRMAKSIAHRRMAKMCTFMNMPTLEDVVLFNQTSTPLNEWASLGLSVEGDFEYRRAVYAEAAKVNDSAVDQAMLYDQKTHLVSLLNRNDKMTMRASIECRVPFLDHRLVAAANRLPLQFKREKGKTKRVLYHRFRKLLPTCVWNRPKWGFGVPTSKWLRKDPNLINRVRSLPSSSLIDDLKLRHNAIKEKVSAFLYDGSNHDLIQTLLMTTIWLEVTQKEARALALKSRSKVAHGLDPHRST